MSRNRLRERVDALIAQGHPVDKAIQLALDPEPKGPPDPVSGRPESGLLEQIPGRPVARQVQRLRRGDAIGDIDHVPAPGVRRAGSQPAGVLLPGSLRSPGPPPGRPAGLSEPRARA